MFYSSVRLFSRLHAVRVESSAPKYAAVRVSRDKRSCATHAGFSFHQVSVSRTERRETAVLEIETNEEVDTAGYGLDYHLCD